jgi:hypothetical protein
MAYQVVVTGDTRPLDKTLATLDKFDEQTRKLAGEVAREVYGELRAQMLTALQFYPPVPPGSRYQRTFRLKRGWVIELDVSNRGDGLQIDLAVKNATPYTQWVVGTLTNVDALARQTQRAFHARNGWPVALDTTRYWFDLYADAFIEALTDAIRDMLRKRA